MKTLIKDNRNKIDNENKDNNTDKVPMREPKNVLAHDTKKEPERGAKTALERYFNKVPAQDPNKVLKSSEPRERRRVEAAFARMKGTYETWFPVVSEHLKAAISKIPMLKPWCRETWVGCEDGKVGCIVCRKVARARSFVKKLAHGNADNFTTFNVKDIPKPSKMRRHELSRGHTQNLAIFLKIDDGKITGAPSTEEFRAVWEQIRQGQSGRKGVSGVGQQHKIWKMAWALAEGMIELDRRWFRRAQKFVTALHRDERDSKVQIRFTASNDRIETRRGLLGIETNSGGADGINSATKSIVMDFFTPMKDPPRGAATDVDDVEPPPLILLEEDADVFCKSTELMNTDAAPDEILANRLAGQAPKRFLPRAKHVARDKSHGGRRLLERGWGADAVLKDLLDRLIRNTESITQMIEHSKVFKRWFKASQPHAKVNDDLMMMMMMSMQKNHNESKSSRDTTSSIINIRNNITLMLLLMLMLMIMITIMIMIMIMRV